MANKYLSLISGVKTLIEAITSSAGAGDAGKIPGLDSSGRLDTSFMPVGIGADTASIEASENLSAGDFVDIYDAAGTPKCRKADASTAGKSADGFVLTGVTSPANATIYFEGQNTQLTGLTAGVSYYLDASTPGGITATPPSTTNNVVQYLGTAINTTTLTTEISRGITLA